MIDRSLIVAKYAVSTLKYENSITSAPIVLVKILVAYKCNFSRASLDRYACPIWWEEGVAVHVRKSS